MKENSQVCVRVHADEAHCLACCFPPSVRVLHLFILRSVVTAGCVPAVGPLFTFIFILAAPCVFVVRKTTPRKKREERKTEHFANHIEVHVRAVCVPPPPL